MAQMAQQMAQQMVQPQQAMVDLQQIVDTLAALDEDSVINVITSIMSARPELAPSVVNFAVPDLTYPPAKALSERRSSGVIKSYNEEKGYGFIQCQELHDVFGNDVFLHSKQNAANFTAGSPVTFSVVLNKDNKPQAYDLQPAAMGKGCMSGIGAGPGQIQQMMMMKGMMMGGDMMGKGGIKRPLGGKGEMKKGPDEVEILGDFQGAIKSFNTNNGYGFIECPEIKMQYGYDVFLHNQQLGQFSVGEYVIFTCYLNSKGQPQGKDLRTQDGGPPKKMRVA